MGRLTKYWCDHCGTEDNEGSLKRVFTELGGDGREIFDVCRKCTPDVASKLHTIFENKQRFKVAQ